MFKDLVSLVFITCYRTLGSLVRLKFSLNTLVTLEAYGD